MTYRLFRSGAALQRRGGSAYNNQLAPTADMLSVAAQHGSLRLASVPVAEAGLSGQSNRARTPPNGGYSGDTAHFTAARAHRHATIQQGLRRSMRLFNASGNYSTIAANRPS
jgi:hypothetical protein